MLPLNGISSPKRRTRARGKVRVEQLIESATELLAGHELTEITFKEVYDHAGIPPGSAYHFFDNIETLYLSLVERYYAELLEFVSGSIYQEKITTWMEMIDILADRTVEFYNGNPAARRILTQPKMNMGTILDVDKRSGARLEEVMNRYFILPEKQELTQVYTLAGKIVHLFVSISASHYGKVSDDIRAELKAAVKGYLKMHLPEMLTKREDVLSFQGKSA